MSNALFLNVPAYGHINPTLPVVEELVRRGEIVTYFAMEPFRDSVEVAGAEFLAYEDLAGEVGEAFDPSILRSPSVAELAANLVAWSERLLPPLEAFIEREQPDYIVRDLMALWGDYAGQRLQVPTIATVPIFPLGPKVKLPLTLVRDLVLRLPRDLPTYLRFFRSARHLSRTYGLERIGLGDIFSNSASFNIVFTSRYLHPQGDAFDAAADEYHFVGPSIAPRPNAPEIDLGETTQPMLYISLGTVFSANADFHRTCFAAFGDTEFTVVVSLGRSLSVADLAPVPDNFIVRPYVPQLKVLQHAAAFITHGGMNSVSEGLYYGVPLVVVPQAVDQYIVARRVKELGAGRVLSDRQLTPEVLRRTVFETLDSPEIKENSAAIAASFRAAGGYKRAAELILDHTQGLATISKDKTL
jgi:MGT family glycosyltransferase